MLKIEFDLLNFEEVEIVPIADVHIGNPLCNEAELKRIVDYILEEPEDPKCARICILNGDLTESATKTSRNGNVFEQTMTPAVQVGTMIKYLQPLTEKSEKYPNGKILSYCAGNHDEGRYKDTGISASETIAVNLGLEDRYSTDGCYSFIRTRKIYSHRGPTVFTVYNQHMTGGGTTVGSKANRVSKITNGVLADLVIGSHVHTPLTFKEDMLIPNVSVKTLMQKTVTYVITNAFLRYGDYAQRQGLKPATISVPRIFLRQNQIRQKKNQMRCTYIEVVL